MAANISTLSPNGRDIIYFQSLKEDAIPVTIFAVPKANSPEAIAACPAKNGLLRTAILKIVPPANPAINPRPIVAIIHQGSGSGKGGCLKNFFHQPGYFVPHQPIAKKKAVSIIISILKHAYSFAFRLPHFDGLKIEIVFCKLSMKFPVFKGEKHPFLFSSSCFLKSINIP